MCFQIYPDRPWQLIEFNHYKIKLVCLSVSYKTTKLKIETRHTYAETKYGMKYESPVLPIQINFL